MAPTLPFARRLDREAHPRLPLLRGNAFARLDPKGRLKVPASFRRILIETYGCQLFVTSLTGASVRVYPLAVFAKIEKKLTNSSAMAPLVARLRTAVNYYGQEVEMDGQGRVLVSPLLRDRAELHEELVVLGQGDYLEVSNRRKFEDELTANPLTSEDLRELASLGF